VSGHVCAAVADAVYHFGTIAAAAAAVVTTLHDRRHFHLNGKSRKYVRPQKAVIRLRHSSFSPGEIYMSDSQLSKWLNILLLVWHSLLPDVVGRRGYRAVSGFH